MIREYLDPPRLAQPHWYLETASCRLFPWDLPARGPDAPVTTTRAPGGLPQAGSTDLSRVTASAGMVTPRASPLRPKAADRAC